MLTGARRFISTSSGSLMGDPVSNRALGVKPNKNRLFDTEADMGGVSSGLNGGGFSASSTVVDKNVANGFLDGFLPPGDMNIRNKIFKDIYDHDPICGGGVDVLSMMPFSDFTLKGIRDHETMDVYANCCNALKLKVMLPALSKDYLGMGKFIGSMFFDSSKKYFTAIMPQNAQYCDIQEVPILGFDPLVNLRVPPNLKKFINQGDPRIKRMLETMPEDFKEFMNQGSVPLQPESTLYIPRRGMSTDSIGTSIYERVLLWHLLEKSLARGTVDSAQRRQRGIIHAVVTGSDDFVASPADLENLKQMIASADSDPVGAVMVTRDGISVNEIVEGGCLAGDTFINTDKGMVTIKSMGPISDIEVGKGYPIDAMVMGSSKRFEKAGHWYFNGHKDLYEVKTESGRTIRSTLDHKYIKCNFGGKEELRLSDIGVGDYILSYDPKGLFCDKIVAKYLHSEKQPVYDLSMEDEKSPWFVASNIVVHNSFWRWDESVETINAQKYRAMSISEALLTGDASYSSLDASMSVMVEQLRSFRASITREIFYDKIFPAIATANDFTKEGFETTGSLKRRKSLSESYNRRRNAVLCAGDSADFKIGAHSFDLTNLEMPTITWQKTLAPVGDQAALDMMKELSGMGIPVPIASMVAAGGMNIDEILSNMDDELALRKELAKYNKRLSKYPVMDGGEDEGGGGYESTASTNYLKKLASGNSLKGSRKKLLSREYDERMDVHDKNSKGKFRTMSKAGSTALKEKQMRKIAKSLGKVRDKYAHVDREEYRDKNNNTTKYHDMKPTTNPFGVTE